MKWYRKPFCSTYWRYDICYDILMIRYLYISKIPIFSTNLRVQSFQYVIHHNYLFTSWGYSKTKRCATLIFRLKAILISITADCFTFISLRNISIMGTKKIFVNFIKWKQLRHILMMSRHVSSDDLIDALISDVMQ